jgi:hypothetical protein
MKRSTEPRESSPRFGGAFCHILHAVTLTTLDRANLRLLARSGCWMSLNNSRRHFLIGEACGVAAASWGGGECFQIVGRDVHSDFVDDHAAMSGGFVDGGCNDTILVAPGETVRIAKPFHDFKGRFVFHCHNLEHENMGMMREFLVE